jgi:N-acetylmuramoyl-L-alanine amidase
MNPLIALCIGHSRLVNSRPEGGAVSTGGKSEWEYNCGLALMVQGLLNTAGIKSKVYNLYHGDGYGAAQRWLAATLKADKATLAVELHFNAAGPTATGHEWLYWESSKNGKALAGAIDGKMRANVPELTARGIKPKTSADRGAEFLRGTHCPACIAEPFFGSNASDWQIATSKKMAIAESIAAGIREAIKAIG